MKERDPRLYLTHVLECIELAVAYLEGVNLREFGESQRFRDAVIRRIEIIGEAVRNLPAEARDAAPGVPWGRIAGMRAKVVYDYMGVDIDLVRAPAARHLPKWAWALICVLSMPLAPLADLTLGRVPLRVVCPFEEAYPESSEAWRVVELVIVSGSSAGAAELESPSVPGHAGTRCPHRRQGRPDAQRTRASEVCRWRRLP